MQMIPPVPMGGVPSPMPPGMMPGVPAPPPGAPGVPAPPGVPPPPPGAPLSAAEAAAKAAERQALLEVYTGPMTPFHIAEDLLRHLGEAHPALSAESESLMDELVRAFKACPEFELFSSVNRLIAMCRDHQSSDPLPAEIVKAFEAIFKAFFEPSNFPTAQQSAFLKEYKSRFNADLHSNEVLAGNVGSFMTKLLKWKVVLQERVSAMESVQHLPSISTFVAQFKSTHLEMPAQYGDLGEPSPEQHDRLDRFLSEVELVRWHKSFHRCLTMRGSTGHLAHFLIQTSLNPYAPSDDRVLQLQRVFNRLLEKNKQTRKRHLAFHVSAMSPLTPHCRLVQYEPHSTPLASVYEHFCSQKKISVDLPISMFNEKAPRRTDKSVESVTPEKKEPSLEPKPEEARSLDEIMADVEPMGTSSLASRSEKPTSSQLRLDAYNDVCSKVVPVNVLSSYVCKSLPIASHLFAFRQQFTKDMALSSVLSYILSIGERNLDNIVFIKKTGVTFHLDLHPIFDSKVRLRRRRRAELNARSG